MFAASSMFAQLGMPLSQFSGNQLVHNPAWAGFEGVLSVNLSARKQWVQLPGSPSLMGFNAHMPLRNDRHALGVVFMRETWGPISGNFAYINYAYNLLLGSNVLSFGVQAGAYNHLTDWDKIEHVIDPFCPFLGKGQMRNTNFDANFGVYFLTNSYYFGLSVKHLVPPKLDFGNNIPTVETWYPHMSTQFFFKGGTIVPLGQKWSLRPELFMRYVHHTPLTVNVGTFGSYMNRYFFGVNYQTGQHSVSFSVRGFVTNNIRIGYSYDVYFGAIRKAQHGSHEISLNWLIDHFWSRDQRAISLPWL